MNAPDIMRAAHPFIPGEGFYPGTWICETCGLAVSDRDEHIDAQLNPSPPPVKVPRVVENPVESTYGT